MKRLISVFFLTLAILYGSDVSGSDLPACKPTIYKSETLLWDKCVGSWEYKYTNSNSTAVYKGEWKDGKYDGYGTYTLADGRKGVGEFRNDKPWNITNYDSFGHATGSWVEGEKQ